MAPREGHGHSPARRGVGCTRTTVKGQVGKLVDATKAEGVGCDGRSQGRHVRLALMAFPLRTRRRKPATAASRQGLRVSKPSPLFQASPRSFCHSRSETSFAAAPLSAAGSAWFSPMPTTLRQQHAGRHWQRRGSADGRDCTGGRLDRREGVRPRPSREGYGHEPSRQAVLAGKPNVRLSTTFRLERPN